MSVRAIIPYRPGSPSRQHAFGLVLGFWQAMGFPFVVADGGFDVPYNVGHARNVGAKGETVDVLVFADADTISRDWGQVANAVWLASEADGLVFCADQMRSLSEGETVNLPRWDAALPCVGDGGRDTDSMSGLLAIRRECFEEVGGFDESYVGYGFEDLDFHRRCARLWPTRWVHGEAIHLWHEPDPEKVNAGPLFLANQARWEAGK